MIVAAIIACEIGFWVVLGAGLLARYLLRRRRLSTVLLLCVPLVDIALLVFALIDLRRGAPPAPAHSMAAIYLGFTVAFGHSIVRWADARAAHRFAGAAPARTRPPSGTQERLRVEWREFGFAVLGAAIAGLVLLAMTALAPDGTGWALFGPLPGVAIALVIWLIGWPLAETVKTYGRR